MNPIEILKAALDQGATVTMDKNKSDYHVEIENDSWLAYGEDSSVETAITQAWEDFQQ